jgi:hypothetical protein
MGRQASRKWTTRQARVAQLVKGKTTQQDALRLFNLFRNHAWFWRAPRTPAKRAA